MGDASVEELDATIRKQSYQSMPKEIALLDRLILHINQGLAKLTGIQHDRGQNFLIGLLLNRAFNCLWRAREDAVLGYGGECLTLCRSGLEHWITARWVEGHSESTDRWLWAILPELPRPTERPPTIDAMLKELGDQGETPRIMYDTLSKFAHPRSIGLRWVIHFDEQSTYFHAGPHYDEHGLRVCLYFLMGVAQAFFNPVAGLQNRMLGSVDAEWLEEALRLSEPAGEFLRRVEDEVSVDAKGLDEEASS